MKAHIYIYALALLLVPLLAHAKDNAEGIRITDAWVRATFPGQLTSAAYLTIISDKNAALVKVETPAAKRADMHSMEMKENIMVMREVESIALPEATFVNLAPGSFHIMLMDMKQPLKAGDKVPLKLSVKRGSETIELNVEAQVRKK